MANKPCCIAQAAISLICMSDIEEMLKGMDHIPNDFKKLIKTSYITNMKQTLIMYDDNPDTRSNSFTLFSDIQYHSGLDFGIRDYFDLNLYHMKTNAAVHLSTFQVALKNMRLSRTRVNHSIKQFVDELYIGYDLGDIFSMEEERKYSIMIFYTILFHLQQITVTYDFVRSYTNDNCKVYAYDKLALGMILKTVITHISNVMFRGMLDCDIIIDTLEDDIGIKSIKTKVANLIMSDN